MHLKCQTYFFDFHRMQSSDVSWNACIFHISTNKIRLQFEFTGSKGCANVAFQCPTSSTLRCKVQTRVDVYRKNQRRLTGDLHESRRHCFKRLLLQRRSYEYSPLINHDNIYKSFPWLIIRSKSCNLVKSAADIESTSLT